LVDIQSGLVDLVRVLKDRSISSIALPPLGCGNGGLDWRDVRPLIEQALGDLPIDVCLFAPGATPDAAAMPNESSMPPLTKARAAVIAFMSRDGARTVGASLLQTQKGLYFLERFGEPMRLEFVKAPYGPYSKKLDHVVKSLEGHYMVGLGDSTDPVTTAQPLFLKGTAASDAESIVAKDAATIDHLTKVFDFIDGFETPYFLELLATLDWIAENEDERIRTNVDLAGELVRSWSPRKSGLFDQDHVEVCWQRLDAYNWLADSAAN
jgi:hypothetical protein